MPVKKSGLQKNIEDVDPYNLGVDARNTAWKIERMRAGDPPDKFLEIKKMRYPEYSKGGVVKETGLAKMHKGELVIPKPTNSMKASASKRLMGAVSPMGMDPAMEKKKKKMMGGM